MTNHYQFKITISQTIMQTIAGKNIN